MNIMEGMGCTDGIQDKISFPTENMSDYAYNWKLIPAGKQAL